MERRDIFQSKKDFGENIKRDCLRSLHGVFAKLGKVPAKFQGLHFGGHYSSITTIHQRMDGFVEKVS
jgi:hypothetical protein